MQLMTRLAGFALLVWLAGGVPAHADPFQVMGSGTKIREHAVAHMAPGGAIAVRIVNARPGYAAFTGIREGHRGGVCRQQCRRGGA